MVPPMRESLDANFYELTQVLFSSSDTESHKVIQITSCHYSEGVTTLTLALASFLARIFGGGVIALEANARRPTFGNLLNLGAHAGLVDALLDKRPVERVILEVALHRFHVVPAGDLDSIPAVEWERALFTELPRVVKKLGESYRFILLDSPPVIPHADSILISPCADGVALVVEAGVTPSEVLDHALKKLSNSKATVLGTILNKRKYFIPKWLYRFI